MDFEILIPEHLAGRQWKSILRGEFGASERLLRQFARDNAVFVNGQPVYLTARADHGDVLTVHLPRETSSVAPEPIPITIAYEDSEILVVNKPPGMLTHPSAKEKYGSLLAGANAHLAQSGLVAHCVHRLDKDTSGLVMMAKHAHFHHLFDHALRHGLIHRTYVAIVDVNPPPMSKPFARASGTPSICPSARTGPPRPSAPSTKKKDGRPSLIIKCWNAPVTTP